MSATTTAATAEKARTAAMTSHASRSVTSSIAMGSLSATPRLVVCAGNRSGRMIDGRDG